MGVPTSEVGYTSAMPRREDHEVRKGYVGHWIKKNNKQIKERFEIQTLHYSTACNNMK